MAPCCGSCSSGVEEYKELDPSGASNLIVLLCGCPFSVNQELVDVNVEVAAMTIFVLPFYGWRKNDLAVDLVCLIAITDLHLRI